MRIGIGIDTGGTYTDAIIYDFDTDKVLSVSKALTTKEDLSLGIGEALDMLPRDLVTQVRLISLSTTLATNACVESKGGRAKLLFMGIDKKIVDWVGKDYGLKDEHEVFCCEAATTFDGSIITEPDWNILLNDTKTWLEDAESLGIVEMYAMNNGATREKKAKELYESKYDFPVICGHELFSDLNSIQRGASTLLNAKLIPIIKEFLKSIKTALRQRNIVAPIVIVRSDSSLMSEAFSQLRPVETILCGPAASVLGGVNLTREENCVIIDMGGTTTDISLVKGGMPVKVSNGISIGNWRTFVKGVFIDTFGLGGDSTIRIKDGCIVILPRRVVPLCIAATKWPSIIDDLKNLLDSKQMHSNPLYEFFYLVKDVSDTTKYTKQEHAFCRAISQKPLIMADAAQAVGVPVSALNTERLEKEGIVMRCGLTPTDIMHIKGDFNRFNAEASELAARYVASCMPLYDNDKNGLDQLCYDVYDTVKKTLYTNIVRILLQDKNPQLQKDGISKQLNDLISQSWEERKTSPNQRFFDFGFSTDAVLVGIGAPTHIFLKDVATALGTKCIIPEHAGVANAIGAIVGNVTVTTTIEISPNHTPYGIDGYTVHGKSKNSKTENMEDAIQIATDEAILGANNEARMRGVSGEITMHTEVLSSTAHSKDGVALDLGTRVVATAIGGIAL